MINRQAYAGAGNNVKITPISIVFYVSGLVAEHFLCGSRLLLPRGAPTEVLMLGASIPVPPPILHLTTERSLLPSDTLVQDAQCLVWVALFL